MRVRFWGTRGSIAKPGRATLRYGGNTSCVEVRTSDGTLVVLDCGTGAHGLGHALMAEHDGPIRGYLLVGHTHLDHIQGLPFFAPLFIPGNTWDIYAPSGRYQQLEASLAGLMAYEYSPIALETLHADVRFHDLREGVFELGSIRVTAQYLNHPALTLGYRLEADGVTLVYATDHEPHALHPLEAARETTPIHPEDQRHVQFLQGADLVIHDAQYTLDDFPAKMGWGHTPMEQAVDYVRLAGAKQLALFHHDPNRHDKAIDRLCKRAKTRAALDAYAPQVFAAAEGQVIELSQASNPSPPSMAPAVSALLPPSSQGPCTVLLVDNNPNMVGLLETALQAEGVDMLTATDEKSALRLAGQEHPALILLGMTCPGGDGLALCRRLRTGANARESHVPILMLGGERLEKTDVIEAFAAGATDYLASPLKLTLLRSRIRAWLLRTCAV